MVIDPGSTAAAAAGLGIRVLELVNKWRIGKLNDSENKELYGKIFCSLLWEIHQNLYRCMAIASQHSGLSAGVLSFFVREALFSQFCTACPEPRIVASFSEIYGAFERVHHWQRVTSDLTTESARFIPGYAKDLFKNKPVVEKYNELVEILKKITSDEYPPPQFDGPTT